MLNDLCKFALSRGIVVKIFYTTNDIRQYSILVHRDWAKVYRLKLPNKTEEIFNVVKRVPAAINYNIDTIQYLYMPKNFNLREFLNRPSTITEHPEIVFNTIKELAKINLHFKDYIDTVLDSTKNMSFKDLKDECYIRFYPVKLESKNKKELLEKIVDDATQKYFILGQTDSENIAIPACNILGLSHNLLDTDDVKLVLCCKRKWFSIIKHERETLAVRLKKEINKTQKRKIKNKAKAIQQLKKYIKLLGKIDYSCMRKCKTVKDIISFWPALMQPAPPYIYER